MPYRFCRGSLSLGAALLVLAACSGNVPGEAAVGQAELAMDSPGGGDDPPPKITVDAGHTTTPAVTMPAWATECGESVHPLRVLVSSASATCPTVGSHWSGSLLFPDASWARCRYVWTGAGTPAAADYVAVESAMTPPVYTLPSPILWHINAAPKAATTPGKIFGYEHPITAECHTAPSCGPGGAGCLTHAPATRHAPPICTSMEQCKDDGMAGCTSCGMAKNSMVEVMVPSEFATGRPLVAGTGDTWIGIVPPGQDQAYVVPIDPASGVSFPDGTLLDVGFY